MFLLRMVFVFVPMALVISGALPASTTVARAAGADIFVAPDGNDQWSGTLSAPNAQRTDGPFATLERARDAIRRLRAARKPQGTLTVQLRGGTYRRGQPFVLRPEDSGSDTGPVVYESYPGEKAVISGGRTISGWRKADGPLWTVELPDVKSGDWYFRQLFVDGRRRRRPGCAGDKPRRYGQAAGNRPMPEIVATAHRARRVENVLPGRAARVTLHTEMQGWHFCE